MVSITLPAIKLTLTLGAIVMQYTPGSQTSAPGRTNVPVPMKFEVTFEGLQLAGLRPSSPAAATTRTTLYLHLLGNLQSIVHLNPEVSDGAFQLGMVE